MRRRLMIIMTVLVALSCFGRHLEIAEGRRVLGKGEFRGDTTLTSISLPLSLREIGPYCFEGCVNLKTVSIADGNRTLKIGEYAFYDCRGLEEIKLPQGTILSTGVFQDCVSLEYLVVPGSVRELPRFFCSGCRSLRRVTLPSGLKSIHRLAFAYCESLESISLPSGLRHIGMNAFSFCGSLRSVTVPASVTELESYAFSECVGLEEATLSNGAREIGELIFSGCRSLKWIRVPRKVPPTFECNSFIFEPDEKEMYDSCALRVTAGSEAAYRKAHGWKLFVQIGH